MERLSKTDSEQKGKLTNWFIAAAVTTLAINVYAGLVVIGVGVYKNRKEAK